MRMIKCLPRTGLDNSLNHSLTGMPLIDRFLSEGSWGESAETYRLPRTNIKEDDKSYILTMEMPGLSKKDIDVSIEGDSITIKGERSEKKEAEGEGVLRREYRSARFERQFTIGKEVDRDEVKATMEDGVLTLTLPKAADQVGRKVDVA